MKNWILDERTGKTIRYTHARPVRLESGQQGMRVILIHEPGLLSDLVTEILLVSEEDYTRLRLAATPPQDE